MSKIERTVGLLPCTSIGTRIVATFFAGWLGAVGGGLKADLTNAPLTKTRSELKDIERTHEQINKAIYAFNPLSAEYAHTRHFEQAKIACPELKPACLINYRENNLFPETRHLKAAARSQTRVIFENSALGGGIGLVLGAFAILAVPALRRPRPSAQPAAKLN